jgi:tape measure domain-containing protein
MLGGLGRMAKSPLTIAATLGVAAAGGATYVAARATESLIKVGAQAEAQISALDRLTGHGEQAYSDVTEMAKRYGLAIDQTAHSYAGFLKMQFPEKEAKRWVALGADMQALGNSADDVQGIFRAIGQIRSKGRLQAEEMLQLSERGVSRELVNKEIAALMGVDQDANGAWRQAVGKLQEQGKVSWDIASKAIERALNAKLKQKRAGESAEDFVKTQITGAFNAAKATTEAFWVRLGRRTAPGVSEGLNSLVDGIERFAQSERGIEMMDRLNNLADSIGQSFAVLGEWVPKAFDAFAEGYGNTSGAMTDATTNSERLKQVLELMLPIVREIGRAFGVVGAAIDSVSSGMAGFQGMSASFGAAQDAGLTTGSGLAHLENMGRWFIGKAPKPVPDNAKGGMVTGVSGGLANVVRAAPGEGLASIGTGEQIVPAGATGGVNVGGVTIHVESSGDPEAVAAATLHAFESRLTTVFAGAMA